MNQRRVLAVVVLSLEGWRTVDLAHVFKVTPRMIQRYRAAGVERLAALASVGRPPDKEHVCSVRHPPSRRHPHD